MNTTRFTEGTFTVKIISVVLKEKIDGTVLDVLAEILESSDPETPVGSRRRWSLELKPAASGEIRKFVRATLADDQIAHEVEEALTAACTRSAFAGRIVRVKKRGKRYTWSPRVR